MQQGYSALVARHSMIPKAGGSRVSAMCCLQAVPGIGIFAPTRSFPCSGKGVVTREGQAGVCGQGQDSLRLKYSVQTGQ
jgi:hypothetical protein